MRPLHECNCIDCNPSGAARVARRCDGDGECSHSRQAFISESLESLDSRTETTIASLPSRVPSPTCLSDSLRCALSSSAVSYMSPPLTPRDTQSSSMADEGEPSNPIMKHSLYGIPSICEPCPYYVMNDHCCFSGDCDNCSECGWF